MPFIAKAHLFFRDGIGIQRGIKDKLDLIVACLSDGYICPVIFQGKIVAVVSEINAPGIVGPEFISPLCEVVMVQMPVAEL
jgi:hypothetical protein